MVLAFWTPNLLVKCFVYVRLISSYFQYLKVQGLPVLRRVHLLVVILIKIKLWFVPNQTFFRNTVTVIVAPSKQKRISSSFPKRNVSLMINVPLFFCNPYFVKFENPLLGPPSNAKACKICCLVLFTRLPIKQTHCRKFSTYSDKNKQFLTSKISIKFCFISWNSKKRRKKLIEKVIPYCDSKGSVFPNELYWLFNVVLSASTIMNGKNF